MILKNPLKRPSRQIKTLKDFMIAKDHTVVGIPKTEHGTRLCHRVICERCERTDYVSLKVGKDKSRFCRTCAETILKRYEMGKKPPQDNVLATCSFCQKEFFVIKILKEKKPDILCLDCLNGFNVWRGRQGESGKRSTIHFRSSNTALRKRT